MQVLGYLYKNIRKLQTQKNVYRRRITDARRRVKLANKHICITQTGLRKEAVNFCLQQLLRKQTKPRSRRFTLEEKIMCLALHKSSGFGHMFLSKWFTLPSRRTLSRLLNKIPADVGINDFLMTNLKESVKTLKAYFGQLRQHRGRHTHLQHNTSLRKVIRLS